MGKLHLRLFGGFDARFESGRELKLSAKKAQAVLAYLALQPGNHRRDKIASLLWPGVDQTRARASLRHALFDLRVALRTGDPDLLRFDDVGMSLSPRAVDVDVRVFERAATSDAPASWAQAVRIYRGDLLDGFTVREPAFDEWLSSERERLRAIAVEMMPKLLQYQTRSASPTVAIQTALRLLALEPLHEAAHRALMRIYAAQGRRSAAVRQYRLCADLLARDLGVSPEPETRKLYEQLVAREVPLTRPDAPDERPRRRSANQAVSQAADRGSQRLPLVARESEIAVARQALDDADAGRGRIAIVRGEAGIGKTRFVQEVAAMAAARGGRVLLGRCYELEHLIPFRPWADAFRSAGLRPGDPALAAVRTEAKAELVRLIPGWNVPGVTLTADPPDYLRLFEAVAAFLEGLAAAAPVLLILEDLHWADEMSVRVLSYLSRRVHDARIVVLVTARDEDLHDSPVVTRLFREMEIDGRSTRLSLARLSRDDTERLVRLTSGGRRDAALARLSGEVWTLSGGNPFVIVETVRALDQQTGRPQAQGLPLAKVIRDITSARLERLGEAARDLVAVASVVGREFSLPLLAAAGAIPERAAARLVEELVRRGVFDDRGGILDFTHERIRHVAYSEIVPARRSVLHRCVAKAIEAVYAGSLEPHYATLAAQYQRAEAWEDAARYFRRAGGHAMARSAAREAVACFAEGLGCLAKAPETPDASRSIIDLSFDVRHPLVILGNYDDALPHLRAAETRAVALHDERRTGRARAYLAHYYYVKGAPQDALRYALEALQTAERLGDTDLFLTASSYAGQIHHVMGSYADARRYLERVIEAVDTAPSPKPAHVFHGLIARAWLVWTLADIGDFARADVAAFDALRQAEERGDVYAETFVCLAVGLLHIRRGAPDQAIEPLERGATSARTREFLAEEASIVSALGLAYARNSQPEDGLRILEGALQRATAMGIGAYLALRMVWVGEAALRVGRTEEAADYGVRALKLAQRHEERSHEAFALKLLGDVAAAEGDRPTADVWYRECLVVAESLRMTSVTTDTEKALADLTR